MRWDQVARRCRERIAVLLVDPASSLAFSYACSNKSTGNIRVVSKNTKCKKGERKLG